MSKEQNDSSGVFEISRIRKLIELLREFDLNEIDLHDATQRIRIKRGGVPMVSAMQAAGIMPAVAASAASTSAVSAPLEDDKNVAFIKSPMVGSFYARPKPDQPAYVKVGDVVAPDTVVCIVEAMKMFNEIPAGIAGKIVEVYVKDGDAVDVNKPLFKLAV